MKHKSLTAAMVLFAVGVALSVWGDPTSITISNASVTVRQLLINQTQFSDFMWWES